MWSETHCWYTVNEPRSGARRCKFRRAPTACGDGLLAYGEWDDTRVQIKWGWNVAIIGCMWVIIRVYRRVREGFGAAFALRNDGGYIAGNLRGARSLHCALTTIVMGRAAFNVVQDSSDDDGPNESAEKRQRQT